MFTVIRGNACCRVGVNDLDENDLVFCADGRFRRATDVPSLSAFLSHAREMRERLAAEQRTGWGAALILIGLGLLLFSDFFDPPPKSRFRWRPRNDEPLTARQRARVRERDGEMCAYCGSHAPDGHVDHRVSRANGGSNRLNNLSWACSTCNWAKGAMNARQFYRLSVTFDTGHGYKP